MLFQKSLQIITICWTESTQPCSKLQPIYLRMQLCAHGIHVSRILMKQLSWETNLILCLIVHQHSEWYLHQASTKESIHWYVKPITGWLAAHSNRPVYSQSSAAALYWRIVYQCLVITSLIYHQQTIERPLTYHWHLSYKWCSATQLSMPWSIAASSECLVGFHQLWHGMISIFKTLPQLDLCTGNDDCRQIDHWIT